MKQVLLSLLFISVSVFANAQLFSKKEKEPEQKKLSLKNSQDSLAYALGVMAAENLSKQYSSDSLNISAAIEAFSKTLKKELLKINQEEANLYIKTFEQKQKEAAMAKVKKEGVQFLKENATKEGVVVLPSGLQYKVLKKGSGSKHPKPSDRVKVHYHGTLIDGSIFDSSIKRGRPAQFPVNAVIQGWIEALQLMKPGDKWVLYIPQELAYGARSAGSIPPYSTLIFEVELIEIL